MLLDQRKPFVFFSGKGAERRNLMLQQPFPGVRGLLQRVDSSMCALVSFSM